MMKFMLAALALGSLASPAAGQATEAEAAQAPAPDAATVHAAERFVELILPRGVLQQMFGSGGLVGMESMLDVRIADFGPLEGVSEPVDPNLTIAEAMQARDPHFRERMRISSEVMNRIVGEVFTTLEPEFRAAMAEMYARRFTRAEFEEMNVFFAREPGRKFAQIAFTMMQDPAFQRMMRTMMPRMAEAGPRIAREVATATAHLPPPPDEDSDDEDHEGTRSVRD